MSTSDQQGHGPLTRKQLREIRLTGSTPVISEEEAAAAAAPPAPPLPRAAEPAEIPPAPAPTPAAGNPLTRRQVRERIRTASVPVVDEGAAPENQENDATAATVPEQPAVEPEPAPAQHTPADDASEPQVVTEVPGFAPSAPASAEASPSDAEPVSEDSSDEVVDLVAVRDVSDAEPVADEPAEPATDAAEPGSSDDAARQPAEREDDQDDEAGAEGERPTVNPAFGQGLLGDRSSSSLPPSFDDLLTAGESGGAGRIAPNALIFTPSPAEGSLSGPVASTGEVLITGSYELPQGLGSQGHAHGTTDGKDVDAVLIDGELPPASSPTPIAASAAVSTSKSAGEVIRPPAPDKGNKLMLALAITAGGLALAVAVALVIAFTTNVL